MRSLFLCLLALAVIATGCGISLDDYERIVEEARACGPGDTCVVAGGFQCVCPSPVNARDAARVDEAARDVACGDMMVKCASHEDVRCEAGRCTSEFLRHEAPE